MAALRSRVPALLAILGALVLTGTWLPAGAAPPQTTRQIQLIQDSDFFGRDLEVLKDVGLETCQEACLATKGCRAFTYNVKARWCFMKAQFKDLRTFKGAIAGRVVEVAAPAKSAGPDLMARRTAELNFLPGDRRKLADQLAQGLDKLIPPDIATATKGQSASQIAAQARAARGAGNGEQAFGLFAAAVRAAPDDQRLWLGLAEAGLAANPDAWDTRNQRRSQAVGAAINAYLRTAEDSQRIPALTALAHALAAQEQWRAAIATLAATLEIREDQALRAEYVKLKEDHGFRIANHRVDAESAAPRICIEFSEPLARSRPNLADFVAVPEGSGLAVEVEDRQICADGATHGSRYAIQVRQGLPAATGEVLEKTVDLDIAVGNRTPAARFQGRAYVLPKGGEASIPVVSVNADRLTAKVYRIGDRSIAQALSDGPFLTQLDSYTASSIADRSGALVWTGTVEVQGQLNKDVTTAIPVGSLVPDLKPGVYALSARPSRFLTQAPASDSECEDGCGASIATQWFVVSDLGLTTLSGNDGLHALVRSLSTAAPIAGATVRLVARNNEVLAESITDSAGYVQFAPGLVRGTGGNTPLMLTAQAKDGDYGFLDLSRSPFDLSDRGVDGRPSPKPLDVFLVAERGVYRPGETVHLTALVRDPKAAATPGVPLTFVFLRPDGVERERRLVPDAGLGGHQADLRLGGNAMRGTWRVQAFSDPKAPALAETGFLVEDFLPERLTFDLKAPDAQGGPVGIDPQNPPVLPIDARFLYGAPAAGLQIEGETQVSVAEGLPAWPGYRFGLADDAPESVSQPLDPATTDDQGRAKILPLLPDLAPTSRLRQAELAVRVLDTGGRPVERNLTLPVLDGQSRIGIKPLFDAQAPEGGTAGFELVALDARGAQRAATGLSWTLEQVETDFQWFRNDSGSYDYEPIERARRIASGKLDLDADSTGRIETPVNWGAYRLRVEADGLLPASFGFDAGWYVAPKTADTPDQLKVSLDKPRYRIGERARVHLAPRGKNAPKGLALVMVVDDRLISMKPVEVPPEGTTLELPVTADWGPGAYVTAALYRPMDLAAKRMPGRAIGLAWAGVDPAERELKIDVSLDPSLGPQRPRGFMPVRIKVPNLKPGTESYITLAAVDQGILNVTGYKPPQPDAWYFGQRRLGLEIRDLYGQLIDRMQGAPGLVRSGGDGGMRTQGPPPTEQLMAYFSGVVRLDENGEARLQVPVPDFNGTIKLMAMAWSAAGVGHGVSDALVRDPVVVTAGLPRFLAPGDRSRLLLGLTLVEGEAGEAEVTVGAEQGLIVPDAAAASRRLNLASGVRADLEVPLEARNIGDETLTVRVKTPAGQILDKRLTLGVRSNAPATMTTSAHELKPGAEALVLTPDLFEGLVPGSGSVLVSASRAGRLDLVGILRALDRYPYGCTEQTTSRALPLLYLDKVALAAGLTGDPAVPPRIADAIVRVMANASSEGRFGLWGPGGEDLWLDSFATDFLTRAKERGYAVSQSVFDAALDNLKNRAAYSNPGPADAYALYVLARNGRASIGDLRYLADERLDDLGSPMAMAQIGAALALYGDRARSDAALTAAAEDLDSPAESGWRADYGSSVRDAAAVLALAAESGSKAVDLRALAARVQYLREGRRYLSTQDNAWVLLAANALTAGSKDLRLEIDGKTQEGAFYGSFDSTRLAAGPVIVRNKGGESLDAMVGVLGVPSVPPPAGGNGYAIERAYYDLEGRRVELAEVPQGTRVVAVVTVRPQDSRGARLIVDDPLPAGFEIDNPNLLKSADIAKIPGIALIDTPAHQEFRSDRFIAAVELAEGAAKEFQLGYLLRAVTPGTYAQPPASVEDMYDPARRAWTDAGSASVTARGR